MHHNVAQLGTPPSRTAGTAADGLERHGLDRGGEPRGEPRDHDAIRAPGIAAPITKGPRPADQGPAVRAFLEGKRLHDDNAGDVDSASRQGLLDAIAAFQKAIALKYPKPGDAYREIGMAYASIALSFHNGLSKAEIEEFWSLARASLRSARELNPADTEAGIDLAMMLRGPERRKLLEDVLRTDPRNGRAHYLLGFELLGEDKGHEAESEFVRAFEGLNRDDARQYGEYAASELRRKGYSREAERVERLIPESGEDP